MLRSIRIRMFGNRLKVSPRGIAEDFIMGTSRRTFLQTALATTLGFKGLKRLFADSEGSPLSTKAKLGAGFGPLVSDPNRLFDLPEGFVYKVISRSGDRMDDGLFVPGKPDGMAAFPGPGGKTILIRNHELLAEKTAEGAFGTANELLDKVPAKYFYDRGRGSKPCLGGTTTLLYDVGQGKVERQYLSLAGTQFNCAGGPTPWKTWLSCEEDTQKADGVFEKDHGYAFEVPAVADRQLIEPVPITPMGRFRREAIAIDPRSGIVYQTEDRPDGLLYRFIPKQRERLLAGGTVQALAVRDQRSLDARNWRDEQGAPMGPELSVGARLAVEWIDMAELQAPEDDLRHRGFAAGAARFARQEGIWFGNDAVYFACTEGGRIRAGQIWKYTPSPAEGTPEEKNKPGVLELFIEPNDVTMIENADNLTVAPWGDLIVCEDGKDVQYLVGVTPEGTIYQLGRNAANDSELAGATFSPDGDTLFFNLQKSGLTIAVSGPWNRRA